MFTRRTAEIMSKFSADAYLEPKEFLKKHPKSMHFVRGSVEAFITFSNPNYTVITFRGTQGLKDAVVDLKALSRDTPSGEVHSGFFSAVERISGPLKRALEKNHKVGKHIYITGHSKGGAEAQLFASHIARLNEVTVYTFGAPRVSDGEYKKAYSDWVERCYAIINDSDPVPRVPKWFKRLGKEIWLDESGRIHFKPSWWKRMWWFVWDKSRLDDHSIDSYIKRLQK